MIETAMVLIHREAAQKLPEPGMGQGIPGMGAVTSAMDDITGPHDLEMLGNRGLWGCQAVGQNPNRGFFPGQKLENSQSERVAERFQGLGDAGQRFGL
jgi:hypothetical protein